MSYLGRIKQKWTKWYVDFVLFKRQKNKVCTNYFSIESSHFDGNYGLIIGLKRMAK